MFVLQGNVHVMERVGVVTVVLDVVGPHRRVVHTLSVQDLSHRVAGVRCEAEIGQAGHDAMT